MLYGQIKKEKKKPAAKPFKHVDKEDVSINIAPTEDYFFKKYMNKVEEKEPNEQI